MGYIDCNKREFYEVIQGKKIVCIGAGGMFCETLEKLDLADKIDILIDNNKELQGSWVEAAGRSYEVKPIEILANVKPEQMVILITSRRYYESIYKQLLKTFPEQNFDVVVSRWMLDYLDREKEPDYFFKTRMIEPALKFYKEHLEHQGKSAEEIRGLAEEKKRNILSSIAAGKLVVPKIGVRHKSSCSLKCRGCSMLIPEINEHYYIKADQVLEDLKLFFESVDECISVGISDGEPFLDKELNRILDYLIQNPKITSISFNTNGTVLPDKKVIPYLKNEKVFVRISDYGYLSCIAKLIEMFEAEGIQFSVLSEMIWYDAGDTQHRNRTQEEIKYNFLQCMNSVGCKVLADGAFYACERCFRMEKLGSEYVSYKDKIILKDFRVSERRNMIGEMYLQQQADACNYCDLGAAEKWLKAGVQPNGRKRSGYTIIRRTDNE